MQHVGRNSQELFDGILEEILQKLAPVIETAECVQLVLDDSPTKRYGPEIEGAGALYNKYSTTIRLRERPKRKSVTVIPGSWQPLC